MTDLRQQVNWIIRQIQCIREKGCLCFGYPTDLSYEAKSKKLSAKFVDGSIQETTIPIPIKLSELENDLGVLDPSSIKYESESTATHAVGSLKVGSNAYPVKETVTVLSYDAAERKLSFVDETGQTRELTLNIPTKTSQLANDGSGAGNAYLTKAEVVVEPALADGHKIATVTVDGQTKEVKETITTLELDKPNKKLVFKSNAGTKDILLSDLASSGAGQTVTHTHQLVNDGADGAHGLYIESERFDSTYIGRGTKEPVTMVQYAAPDGIKHPVAEIYETVTSIDETAVDEELRSKSIVFTNEKGERTSIAVSVLDARDVAYNDKIFTQPNKHLIGQLKHGGRMDNVHETITSLTYSERENKLYYVDENARTTNISLKVPKKTSELVNDGDGNGSPYLLKTDECKRWHGDNTASSLIYRNGFIQSVSSSRLHQGVLNVNPANSSVPIIPRIAAYDTNGKNAAIVSSSNTESQFVLHNQINGRYFIIANDARDLNKHGSSPHTGYVTFRGANGNSEFNDILCIYSKGGLGYDPVVEFMSQIRVDTNKTIRPRDEWWYDYKSGFDNAKQITPDEAARMLRRSEVLILKDDVVHRVNAFTMMLVMAQAMTAVKTS